MKKKYKFTFFLDRCKIASCVVNVAKKGAFERLIGNMPRICSRHNYNVKFEIEEFEVSD